MDFINDDAESGAGDDKGEGAIADEADNGEGHGDCAALGRIAGSVF